MSSIHDNYKNGKVKDFLLENINKNANLSFVSAYFTIYAYNHLKVQLNDINHLRFLFGEPRFIKNIDPTKVNKRDFKIEDDKLIIPIESHLLQKSIAKECAKWIAEKVEIKSIKKPNFLHGKLYLVENDNRVNEAIMGSSNFTVSGLGFAGKRNIELNLEITDKRDINDLKEWFNNLWNDESGIIEDVKEEVLKYLETIYVENEPNFIYFKTLFHIFEKFISEQQKGGLLNEKTGFLDTEIWNNFLYDFQKDGVKGAINKILKHNGCIIADSVGLGKTFEALAVIKYFELLNYRVLVICPKKLSGNWTIYQSIQNNILNPFKKDKFNYTVLYHTDLGRVSGDSKAGVNDLSNFNWGAYDLVVIDESHNFRGNPMEKTKQDGSIRMNRAKWLMEKIIKNGVDTKILMLSATPVNNNLKDLRNQINFITKGRNDALLECCQIDNIAQTLENAQKNFTNWADSTKNPKRTMKQLLEKLDSAFFKLLDELTIARSRKHILSFYNDSKIGKFPERLKPKSEYSKIDTKDRFFTYDTLNKKILDYKLSIFNPTAYVKNGMIAKYDEISKTGVKAFKQSDREYFLIGMMKVNFLKRIESSIKSFEISIDRTIIKIEKLIEKLNKFKQEKILNQLDDFDEFKPDDIDFEDNESESDEWKIGKKMKFDLEDLEIDEWLKDLETDKQALIELYNSAVDVTPERDAKLKDLKKLIDDKIKNPINENNKKVVIFTAFADTAKYIYDCLKDWSLNELKLNIAIIAGSFTYTTYGKNDFDNILVNFSPISKNRSKMENINQDNQIDILIATDCISEGQNLQDCDLLINYDIHWNPVRIIQRFGRIDRLGSKNDKIQLINFWPTEDLDNYINLKTRVEARMALVDLTATADDNLLNNEQIKDLITDDLKYRNSQLKKLQTEIIDIEQMDENISLTDFTLDDFRIELLNFLENNSRKLEDAPFGLYAIVPSPTGNYSNLIDTSKFSNSEKDIIKSGVIFCLKQKGETQGNVQVNPLQPYFLVFIKDDGTVRYNYVNAKQILEIFRRLCQDKNKPFDILCDLFNSETINGEDMKVYTKLLEKSVKEIKNIFQKKSNSKLSTDRNATIISMFNQIKEINNFELVTWLVIK